MTNYNTTSRTTKFGVMLPGIHPATNTACETMSGCLAATVAAGAGAETAVGHEHARRVQEGAHHGDY